MYAVEYFSIEGYLSRNLVNRSCGVINDRYVNMKASLNFASNVFESKQ